MRRICIVLLTVTFLNSCLGGKPDAGQIDSIALMTNAAVEAAKKADTLGPVIQRIHFSVAMVDQESRLVDYVPWISIDKASEQLVGLKDPDNIVLPYRNAKLIIDYPLSRPVVMELKNAGEGFSTKKLISAIAETYHTIYREEDSTSRTKTIPVEQREGLLNRNETDGKYGIWGHDLSDLSLNEIEVYQHRNGEIYLRLGIDS